MSLHIYNYTYTHRMRLHGLATDKLGWTTSKLCQATWNNISFQRCFPPSTWMKPIWGVQTGYSQSVTQPCTIHPEGPNLHRPRSSPAVDTAPEAFSCLRCSPTTVRQESRKKRLRHMLNRKLRKYAMKQTFKYLMQLETQCSNLSLILRFSVAGTLCSNRQASTVYMVYKL